MKYKRVTMRIEMVRTLRRMLEIDKPMTANELCREMGTTIANTNRKLLSMLDQKLVAREQRYLPVSPSRISGRTTIYFVWVTIYGKQRLAEYKEVKPRRPGVPRPASTEVATKPRPAPTKAPTRPNVGRHVPNSIFDLARVYAQKE